MKKQELTQIIKEELQKVLSETNTKVQDQGYANDYYNISSDITETWINTETITKDIIGFLQAAHATAGTASTIGGPKLVKEVMNAILKGIEKSKPLLRKERGSDIDSGEDLS